MQENCPFDITPLAESQVNKKTNIFNLNYTCQDFNSLKARLRDYNKQQFAEKFNDYIESSLAIMLMENVAFCGDTLSFKIDQLANEVYIDTVTEKENAFRLSRLVGFEPLPPLAARSLFTATLNNTLLTDVMLTTPLEIKTVSGNTSIVIELFPADSDNNPLFEENITIPAGNLVNSSIIGLEGQTFTDEAEGNGAVGQTITLAKSPVIWGSVRVDVDGVRWEQVDYFTDSQKRREYRIEYDSNYVGYIVFGNNRAGLLPSSGSRIRITYRVGGGSVGNITAGSIDKNIVANVPGFDFVVPVGLKNYTRGQNGYDGDSVDDIRRKLPAYVKAQNRAVTGLDYKTLADQFANPYHGSIGKSTAVLRNYGCAGNVIDLYVLAQDGNSGLMEASSELLADLQEEIDSKKMLTDYLCIRHGSIIYTDVSVELVLDKFYKKFEDELKEKIKRRVEQFFSLPQWEFGKTLRDTDLIKALSDLPELTRIDINFVTDTANGPIVTTKFFEIIRHDPDSLIIAFNYE